MTSAVVRAASDGSSADRRGRLRRWPMQRHRPDSLLVKAVGRASGFALHALMALLKFWSDSFRRCGESPACGPGAPVGQSLGASRRVWKVGRLENRRSSFEAATELEEGFERGRGWRSIRSCRFSRLSALSARPVPHPSLLAPRPQLAASPPPPTAAHFRLKLRRELSPRLPRHERLLPHSKGVPQTGANSMVQRS
jgi:hypothetical protein